jgi:hypothetical protein
MTDLSQYGDSPVSLSKPFALDDHSDQLNLFVPLGNAPKGRFHFALFFDKTLDWEELEIDPDSEAKHGSDFIQYLIRSIEDKIIGSLFVVNHRKLTFNHTHCSIIDSDLNEAMAILVDNLGGTVVYHDNEESFLVVPYNPRINQFMVLS